MHYSEFRLKYRLYDLNFRQERRGRESDGQVFDHIRQLQRGRRNEYEITELNNRYVARQQLRYDFCRGRWTDAGTFESYMEANRLLFDNGNYILAHPEDNL